MPRRIPFHRLMIALCVAGHLLQVSAGPELTDQFALYGPALAQGEWWRAITTGFLHLNLTHLFLNSLSLYVLGSLMEPLYDVGGRTRFATLYVASLLGGSAGALLLDFDVPVIGASGAVFGVMGAAAALPLRCGFGVNRFKVVPWLALNLVITFAVPGISVGAHLGGLLVGFALGWFLAPVGRLEDLRTSR